MSDVKLERGHVEVEGQLKVEGTDIHLNAESRRDPSNEAPYRRALVHGRNDELIVNYGDDYNGVMINARKDGRIKLYGSTYTKDLFVNDHNVLDILKFLLSETAGLYNAVNKLERNAGLSLTASQKIVNAVKPALERSEAQRLKGLGIKASFYMDIANLLGNDRS